MNRRQDSEGWPAQGSTMRCTSSALSELEERRRSFPGLREDKGGAWRTRIAGMIDAWRSSPASTVAGRGMGAGATQYRAQERNSVMFE